ncbi:MAG: Spy/CpxP family protein refolding chaperone [Ignavibacteria bacterium]
MNNLITKSMFMLAAVFVTVFASSCTDQLTSTSPIMDDVSTEMFASMYDAESIATSIIDDNDQGMFAKGDRGRGPGRGRGKDDRDSSGKHDGLHPKRAHLRAVIDCLKLTEDQMKQVQALHQAKHDCEKSAREEFRAIAGPIRQEERALIKSLHEQLSAGTITRAEANAQLEAFRAKNASAMQAAIETMKVAVKACNDTLLAGIEAMLTPEQLLLWNQWKATGSNPCDTPSNGDVIGG